MPVLTRRAQQRGGRQRHAAKRQRQRLASHQQQLRARACVFVCQTLRDRMLCTSQKGPSSLQLRKGHNTGAGGIPESHPLPLTSSLLVAWASASSAAGGRIKQAGHSASSVLPATLVKALKPEGQPVHSCGHPVMQ